jgi:hypothetical protein
MKILPLALLISAGAATAAVAQQPAQQPAHRPAHVAQQPADTSHHATKHSKSRHHAGAAAKPKPGHDSTNAGTPRPAEATEPAKPMGTTSAKP